MRMAIACLVVLVTVQAGQANASSRDVSGELRVLYALVTWGPTPFAPPDAERVAAETADFFDSSSGGRFPAYRMPTADSLVRQIVVVDGVVWGAESATEKLVAFDAGG